MKNIISAVYCALSLCAVASPALAAPGDVWGVANLRSKHFTVGLNEAERQEISSFNQNNYGAGFEYHYSDDIVVIGGGYRNSNDRDSAYAALGWTPLHWGVLSAGVAAGGVTGYHLYTRSSVMPMVIGLIRLEGTGYFSRFGANLMVLPPVREMNAYSPLTLGIQIKYKFN